MTLSFEQANANRIALAERLDDFVTASISGDIDRVLSEDWSDLNDDEIDRVMDEYGEAYRAEFIDFASAELLESISATADTALNEPIPPREHPCPYKRSIHGDMTECRCDAERTRECEARALESC